VNNYPYFIKKYIICNLTVLFHDDMLCHKLIFCIDYGYIEAVEKKFKDLLSKEKENIKPCEENVLVSGKV